MTNIIFFSAFIILQLISIAILFFLLASNKKPDPSQLTRELLTDQMTQLLSQINERFRILQSDLLKDQHEMKASIIKEMSEIQRLVQEKIVEMVKLNSDHAGKLNKDIEALSHRLNRDQADFKEALVKTMDGFKTQFQASSEKMTQTVDQKLEVISGKVTEKLVEGFEKTNKTFIDITNRLTKIDEAQKKIESLSQNVVSLQDILNDKKSRGVFGEVQLHQILASVFGDGNSRLFQLQYKFSTGTIVDAVLFLPEPIGLLPIDSKFPLENYQRMIDPRLSDIERDQSMKLFRQNLKKHVDDIADKYLIANETADIALLFLPAEVIFAELYSYHQEIITYAQQRKVWVVSPSTFMGMLTTIQSVMRDIETQKQARIIQEELNKLAEEFKRFKNRWTSLNKHIEQVSDDVKGINTTTDKITKRFEQIERVELDEPDIDEPLSLIGDRSKQTE